MKRTLALFALSALAAPLALAAPNPAWAIPGTEILAVGDRLNQEPPNQQAWDAHQKKWMSAVKDAGGAVPEAYQPLLKAAFGMTPEGEVRMEYRFGLVPPDNGPVSRTWLMEARRLTE